jgi:hypothetical protein
VDSCKLLGQIGAIASVATVYFTSGYGLRGDRFALGMAGKMELLGWASECGLNLGTIRNRSEAYRATLGGVLVGVPLEISLLATAGANRHTRASGLFSGKGLNADLNTV